MVRDIQAKLHLPTTIGCGALAVWSLYALVVSEIIGHLPVFETLFLMFSISFVAMALRITALKRWHLLKQPWFIWIIGILGVCGSDLAYVTAVKYAPPAHVDFIDYLWPFLVILFSGFLPKEKLTLQHMIAGGLGFLGVLLLLFAGRGGFALQGDYIWGYLFALIAALIWSIYTIVTRWYQNMPMEMVGMYCGIGALIALVLHYRYETWVVPTLSEGIMVSILGLSSGVAYLLWSYGTQKGNLKLLGIFAYFTPILSMGLLVMTGKEPFSFVLIISCALVVAGIIVGSIQWGKNNAEPVLAAEE